MAASEPHPNCGRCPRLRRAIVQHRKRKPTWFNAPVPTWLPRAGANAVKLLIIGLAPGLKGANRTGRAFTGDASGEMLHAMLLAHGFASGTFENRADDTMQLEDCAITNAVRCVPPQNKPTGAEIANCQKFLAPTIASFPNLKAVLTLGKIAHDSTVRTLNLRVTDMPFGHHKKYSFADVQIISSYHCSRYNVNTGRLTEPMFEEIFDDLRRIVDD